MNQHCTPNLRRAVNETLGSPGRMVGLSKPHYDARHPDHVTVFNANICLDHGKVWWGDLDLTLDEPRLVELAARIGETVHVLHERDGRFEHEHKPLLGHAVYSVTPDGRTRYQHDQLERAPDGTLRRRSTPANRKTTGRSSA